MNFRRVAAQAVNLSELDSSILFGKLLVMATPRAVRPHGVTVISRHESHRTANPLHRCVRRSSRSNHAALGIVWLVVFIDLLGFGIVLPVLPRQAEPYLQGT